jgi:hypothetical protein
VPATNASIELLPLNGTAAVLVLRCVNTTLGAQTNFWSRIVRRAHLCMLNTRHYLCPRTPNFIMCHLTCYCLSQNLHTCAKSSSAYTVVGSCSHVASTSANGPTTVEWPQAWYPASGLRAGEHVMTKHWLSTARARASSSQCRGPVTVLNAPARQHKDTWQEYVSWGVARRAAAHQRAVACVCSSSVMQGM